MVRWKWLLVGLVLLNVALLVLGSGKGARPVRDKGAAISVGLVFDVGGLGDKSFNDAAYNGLLRAQSELGADIRMIEPGDGSDCESALRQLISEGYPLVIGVGFIFSDDIRKLAKEFPETHFATVDFSAMPNEVLPANLIGLRFREHEGSFLVGAVAGLVSKSQKVGFIGGMDIPLIQKFEAGYTAGVKKVCPNCQVFGAYAGTDRRAFSDPVLGKELALSQYGRGADIIFHAAGKTGSGVFAAAQDTRKWAIGVDADQFREAPCCVLTSMIKRVDVAVFDTVKSLKEGTFQSGVKEFGLAEAGVEFVLDDNNRERIPAEVIERVKLLSQEIIAGTLVVPES